MICGSLTCLRAQQMLLDELFEIKFPMIKVVQVINLMTLLLKHSNVLWTCCFLTTLLACDIISLRSQTQSLNLEFGQIISEYLFEQLTQLVFKYGLYISGLIAVKKIQILLVNTVLTHTDPESE